MDELSELRKQIDAADSAIIRAVADRMEIVRAVGRYKKGASVPVVQPARITAVSDSYARQGEELGLDPEFARRLYAFLLEEAHRIEEAILAPAPVAPH
jgi:chorismate mutase-like protein